MRNALLRLLLVLSLGAALSACQSAPQRQAAASAVPLTASAVPPTATARRAAAAPAPTAPVHETPAASVVTDTYRVINTYPHDREAFTQGLAYSDGTLYEGTGLYGQSSLRAVDLTSGRVLKQRSLAADVFGEGIAVVDNRILQLTWQSKTGFVYDRASFEPTLQWSYTTEGWGLTYDGTSLIMSDGTATLRFLDPVTFRETRRIEVVDASGPVTQLNELEYVNGQVWANVWRTDRIARIDPTTGTVQGWIDLTGLLSAADRGTAPVDVLNGIAYDAATNRLFVTGKLWPKLYEIHIIPRALP